MNAPLRGEALLSAVLDQAMAEDPAIMLLGESAGRLGDSTSLAERFGPDRVVALPIADRANMGLALGLALGARRPVIELANASRLMAAYEVLVEAASLSRQGERVPLTCRVAVGGEGGELDPPVADLLAIDGLKVATPSQPGRAAGLLRAALASRSPVVLLEPRQVMAGRGLTQNVGLDRAEVLQEGDDIVLAAWGTAVEAASEAAQALEQEGVSAEVIDLVALQPLDHTALGKRVERTGRLVVVHPHEEPAHGFPGRVVRSVLNTAFDRLEAPPVAAKPEPEAVLARAWAALEY